MSFESIFEGMLIDFTILRRGRQSKSNGRPIEGSRSILSVKGRYNSVGGSYTGKLHFDEGTSLMENSLFFYTQQNLFITGQYDDMQPDFVLIDEGNGAVFMYKVDIPYKNMDNDTSENNINHNRYLIRKTIKFTNNNDWLNGVLNA
jgi:hypothetical protein